VRIQCSHSRGGSANTHFSSPSDQPHVESESQRVEDRDGVSQGGVLCEWFLMSRGHIVVHTSLEN